MMNILSSSFYTYSMQVSLHLISLKYFGCKSECTYVLGYPKYPNDYFE